MKPTQAEVARRFLSRINKDAPPPECAPHLGNCWLWTGGTHTHGYGYFPVGGRHRSAHRFSYELLVGPIPEGLQLDHLCRIQICVNPSHLEPVTARVNTLRSTSFAARYAVQTHCIHGHPFDAENTYIQIRDGRQHRACKTCKNNERLRRATKVGGPA